jgi:hypothetical protein
VAARWRYESYQDIYAPLQVVAGHAALLPSGVLERYGAEAIERSSRELPRSAASLRAAVEAPLDDWQEGELRGWRSCVDFGSLGERLQDAVEAADYRLVILIVADLQARLHGSSLVKRSTPGAR